MPTRRAGPFATVETWSAHHRVVLVLDRRGAAALPAESDEAVLPDPGRRADDSDDGSWVAQLGAGAIRQDPGCPEIPI